MPFYVWIQDEQVIGVGRTPDEAMAKAQSSWDETQPLLSRYLPEGVELPEFSEEDGYIVVCEVTGEDENCPDDEDPEAIIYDELATGCEPLPLPQINLGSKRKRRRKKRRKPQAQPQAQAQAQARAQTQPPPPPQTEAQAEEPTPEIEEIPTENFHGENPSDSGNVEDASDATQEG